MTGQRVRAIIDEVLKLACEYYGLTGRPLGLTGEIGVQ